MTRIRRSLNSDAKLASFSGAHGRALLALLIVANAAVCSAAASGRYVPSKTAPLDPRPAAHGPKLLGQVASEDSKAVSATVTAEQLRKGLMLHYSFDDDSKGKVYDESGNENHGRTIGAVQYQPSFSGQASKFSNRGTYVICDSPGINMHGWRQMAVSVWIKTDRHTTYANIINRGEVTGDTASGFTLRAGGRLCKAAFSFQRQYQSNPPTSERLNSSTLQPQNMDRIGKWVHVVGTFDGKFLRFYIDGKLDREVEVTSDGLHIWDKPEHKLVIGTASQKSRMAWYDKFFDGQIDEVKIWKRSLSDEDVAAIHRHGAELVAASAMGIAKTDPKLEAKSLLYDASLGPLPHEQGFTLIDDESGHGPPCAEQGVFVDGPTTTKGMRCWKSHGIPLDFRPQGKGLTAEWKLQVVDSSVDATGHYSGWSASFVDQFGHQFLIGLGNNRIVLHNMTRDPNPNSTHFDTTDRQHHFRFVVDDNQGTLYVDGKRLLSKPLGTPDKRKILVNRVLFGDGTAHAGAHTKLWSFGYAADAGAALHGLALQSRASSAPLEIAGCDNFDWTIRRTNCDGWEFENAEGRLKATQINAAVASTTTQPTAPWATVELSHTLPEVHDFTLEAEISWNAPGVRAIRHVAIELAGSEGRVASVSHNDSWYDFRGSRVSYLNDKRVQSPYNTEPLSGSATLTLIRSDGKTRILWDGKPMQTGNSGRPLDRVNLTFGFYPYDGARKSVFGTVTIHCLSLKTP